MDIRSFANQLFDRGDDPFKLAGKRDDTMDLLLAMLSQQNVPDPWLEDEEEKKKELDPLGAQKKKDAESWAEFVAMNPSLDLAAVARQSGGNVPGGNVSMMESTIKQQTPGASDEEFFRWVDEFSTQTQLDSLLDPRSRGFNPDAAEQIIRAAALKEQQRQQRYLEDITNRATRSSGGSSRIPPEEAMAMMNAWARVPDSMIDRQMSTMDYANAIQRARADAINFVQRVTSDPTMVADPAQVEYSKKVIKISQKYAHDPEMAYMEIAKLSPYDDAEPDPAGVETPLNQGGWGRRTDESGNTIRTFRRGNR
jgi:hypothetical protein